MSDGVVRLSPGTLDAKRVLLIEDQEEAMFLVQQALVEDGPGAYQLEWANRVGAGLARLAEGGVDLVVLDLCLPDGAGPENYTRVRQIAPELPVVVLTSDSSAETKATLAAKGVARYLVKGELADYELREAIQQVLQ